MSTYYPATDDWFGSIRIVVIIFAVVLVIGYNLYNRRSKGSEAEEQARSIQRDFESMSKSVDETRKL
jgi:hypothetical protein